MPKSAAFKRPRISEADVQQAVVTMLELDNWRPIRTHPLPPVVQRLDAIMAKSPSGFFGCWKTIRSYVLKHTHRESFGETSMADYLFVRYSLGKGYALNLPFPFDQGQAAEVMWIEFKSAGKKATQAQILWALSERARGALVMTFDSLDAARDWYKTSGLCRNSILS